VHGNLLAKVTILSEHSFLTVSVSPGCTARKHPGYICPFPDSVDTWLRHDRPRFVLGQGMIAKGRLPVRPIREHLTVLEDLPFRIVAGRVVPRGRVHA